MQQVCARGKPSRDVAGRCGAQPAVCAIGEGPYGPRRAGPPAYQTLARGPPPQVSTTEQKSVPINSPIYNKLTYMDPPVMSRKSREEKHVSGQMPSYIRPLGEGIASLRALMQSALPLLNKTSASKAASTFRIGGSRSDLSCHQLDHPSHRAVRCLHLLSSTHRF